MTQGWEKLTFGNLNVSNSLGVPAPPILGKLLINAKLFASTELGGLIKFIRPFLQLVSKAKAAKLVRTLVDCFLDMEATTGMEV